jgi:hypothetical protein
MQLHDANQLMPISLSLSLAVYVCVCVCVCLGTVTTYTISNWNSNYPSTDSDQLLLACWLIDTLRDAYTVYASQ